MKYTGLNKLLYQRRKELRFSLKEAAIKLDISVTKLKLIEQGYIKVKNKELQDLIIYKYELPENFFNTDPLEYPTIIEDAPQDLDPENKFVKALTSLPFKIVTFVLALGFIGMCIAGATMTPLLSEGAGSFYSKGINQLQNTAVTTGKKYDHLNPKSNELRSITATIVNEDYYAIEDFVEFETLPEDQHIWFTSINFFKDSFNLPYTFFGACSIIGSEEIPYYPDLGTVTYMCTFETRVHNGKFRTHFYAYEYVDKIDYTEAIMHISVDHDFQGKNFKYNLIEADPTFVSGVLEPVEEKSFEGFICTTIFRYQNAEFAEAINTLFNNHAPEFKMDAKTFINGIGNGTNAYNGKINQTYSLITWGSILGIVFFGICGLSLLGSAAKKDKIKAIANGNIAYSVEEEFKEENKPLPKNKFPPLIVPEFLIRLFAIGVALLSSLGIYWIFQSIASLDPIGLIEDITFKQEIAAFSTMSMLLLLFLKLDMRQRQKDTFLGNYFLFFFGLIFYVLLILVQTGFAESNSIISIAGNMAMEFLPGNIIWGILAFNLLSSSLFSEPEYIRGNKKRTLIYRLTAIIPILYMVASVVIQVGKKAGNWEVPFAINSLFFSKALFLTAFTVLYCFGVYGYRKLVVKKYGSENAEIYQAGNRYYYTKNLIVCAIVAILGVTDIIISKCWANNPIGAGGNYVILFTIPFILLYHPHHGKRNIKWDFGFILAYGLSMVLGIILVASSLSIYINAI